jgi:hypothetical protein
MPAAVKTPCRQDGGIEDGCVRVANEDRCPASGRDCRKRACELGGCQEAKRAGPSGAVARAEEADARVVGLRAQLLAALASRKRLEEALDDALALAGECDAILSDLQKALGGGSARRLDKVRALQARLREARRARLTDDVVEAVAA